VMVISLLTNSLGYLLFSHASTLFHFAILMIIQGASNPLYRIGADAMMADLIPPEKRVDGYSLMRLSNNIGVAIGPAAGGIIASVSYAIAFYCAAVGLAIYGFLLAFLAHETLPQLKSAEIDPYKEKEYPWEGIYTFLVTGSIWSSLPLSFLLRLVRPLCGCCFRSMPRPITEYPKISMALFL